MNNLELLAKMYLSQLRYNEMLRREGKLTDKNSKEAEVLKTALFGVGFAQEGEYLGLGVYLNYKKVFLQRKDGSIAFEYKEEEGVGI